MFPPEDALPLRIRDHPRYHEIASGYNLCRNLEWSIQREIDLGKDLEKDLIHCRILGYLFHYFPARDIKPFVREIVTTNGRPRELLQLGEFYYDFFIRSFKSNEGKSPPSSSPLSPHPSDNVAQLIECILQEAPQDRRTAKKHALVRDSFQCPVTKVYDWDAVMCSEEMEMKITCEGAEGGFTQCVHIFLEFTNANITPDSTEFWATYAASVWGVLDRFGYSALREELNGPNIHRLENIVTMEKSLRIHFDRLWIWFTATEEPNTYKLEEIRDWLISRYPNPTYLSIHAACAKIAHVSGAGRYIEKIFRCMADVRALSEGGGSAELLDEAILSSMHAIPV
ncbi:hypothetical protein F5J12DRAFT_889345 [Pisolithus orientalis]|uniref:uncharacterized protein n=1 Tax=Pisolithus orientalis TaxID=936130 RepID=UPI00222541A6|nr:uncharacterized protein F5J12DRAFT_889345 [Pisolithus orientalis]KAI6028832.1 hypothetical protein F5J12DRAFT_889345 [Pisolithus orientalis]